MQRSATVDASTILRRAWLLADGGDFDDADERPDVAGFRRLITAFDTWLKAAWRAAAWPDLCPIEKRHFRELWSTQGPELDARGEFVLDVNGEITLVDRLYDATEEIFYPNTGKYYQSLRDSNLNNRPADADGVENSAWWAESANEYTADDWAASTDYAVGDQVRLEDDNEFYQCHTAHTSGSSFDATKFGLLTPFVRYVEFDQWWKPNEIGLVLDVWESHPRALRNTPRVPFKLGPSRFEVTRNLQHCYVRFRLPCPELANARVFDAARTYYAGEFFYFTTTSATIPDVGNFYRCKYNTAAGETPETFAEKFERVEIPAYFSDFLTHAMVADLQQTDTEYATAVAEKTVASAAMNDDVWALLALPNEERETLVYTR